jgi:mono/diheme cytochrome c family protein|uniref:C-type cytochrome n=1 Tax=Desulfurella acetivorans TaxID=33002 RepID=A0A832ADY7_DESAE
MKKYLFCFVGLMLATPVASSAANIQHGKQLFESICAPCHGSNARGNVGPNIVDQSVKKIEWALNNVGMMKPVKSSNPQLNNVQNIKDISAFLHTLKK